MTVKASEQIIRAIQDGWGVTPHDLYLDRDGVATGRPGWIAEINQEKVWLGRNLQEALAHVRDESGNKGIEWAEPEWTSPEGWVYLLHFDRPIGAGVQKAQHYLGYTSKDDIDERLTKHQLGTGAALPREANRLGIGFTLTRKWRGNRKLEKKLKDNGHLPRLCSICQHTGQGQQKGRKYYKAINVPEGTNVMPEE